MGKTIQVRVHPSLVDIFGNIGKAFAEKIKKEYNLTELIVADTIASQILAGQYKGQKIFEFEVEKTGLNKGRLILRR